MTVETTTNFQNSKRHATIQRYLKDYAESQARAIASIWSQVRSLDHQSSYRHVLVIPAYDEPVGCIDQVLPSTLSSTLVIVVVNAAVDSDRLAIERTQQLLQSLTGPRIDSLSDQEDRIGDRQFTLVPHTSTTDLLIVDCCTIGRQLPPKQGVGLARKIGGDIALAGMMATVITSTWIHYTDADVGLPEDFFAFWEREGKREGQEEEDGAVYLYPFRHYPWHQAIGWYETSLRYYVLQLEGARSPYAFHTIGSLMCINSDHYAQVRGFPKRKAAEDFYMLNKLAKTGAVIRLQHPIVRLDSRVSHRVPFGTGAMMTRLAQSDTAQASSFEFYHPAIFGHLQDWLSCMDRLWLLAPEAIASLEVWLAHSPWQNAPWIPCLLQMGLEKTVAQAHRQSRDRPHFRLFMGTWFDAFRTLKLIHYLRDHHYPSLCFEQLIPELARSRFWHGHFGQESHGVERRSPLSLESFHQHLLEREAALSSRIGPTLAMED